MEDPQEDPLAVHCVCVCGDSALLGDLLGVSRSVECYFLSLVTIYRTIFSSVLFVLSLIINILLCLSILIVCSCVLVVLV